MTRAQQAKAAIAALGDTPDVDVARRTLAEFDTRDQAAALISTAGGAAPGGSQTVRVLGPFHYDFTDFTQEDDELTIFTPDAGDIILSGFGDPVTAVNFDDSGSIDFTVGENPDFNAGSYTGGFWGFLGNSIQDTVGFPDSDKNAAANPASAVGGVFVSTGAPIKIRAVSVVGDGTAGAMDIYFLVATPTAP